MSHDKKKRFLNKPYYPGGGKALDAFIHEQIEYPAEALEARVEGVVKVRITLDHRGRVTEAQALNKLGHGLDEEAERVARNVRFTVDKNIGLRVTFNKELNIRFQLPRPQPQTAPAANAQYTYTYTPARAQPKSEKKPAKQGGYSIVIKR